MKKPSFRGMLREVSSFLLFFLLVAFVVTCCMLLFLNVLATEIGLVFTSENITDAANRKNKRKLLTSRSIPRKLGFFI